jgi:hypothetical protein
VRWKGKDRWGNGASVTPIQGGTLIFFSVQANAQAPADGGAQAQAQGDYSNYYADYAAYYGGYAAQQPYGAYGGYPGTPISDSL